MLTYEGTSEVHQLVIGQALTGESAFSLDPTRLSAGSNSARILRRDSAKITDSISTAQVTTNVTTASWTSAGSPATQGIVRQHTCSRQAYYGDRVHRKPLEDHMAQQIEDHAAHQGRQRHGGQRVGEEW